MRPQLGDWHPAAYRNAVADDMQVRLVKVHDTFAVRVLDVRVANVPLTRHSPVKHRRSRGDFLNGERNLLLDAAQCGANTVARNASADGVEFRDQLAHALTGHRGFRNRLCCACVHNVSKLSTLIPRTTDNSDRAR